ncbi:Wzz/FepE/Etk N-terminal domain-containing protein [Vibrio cincinnatiensis]|uniref:Wzz/FepE/Etk N-terminal domain-containing protein n=1 Tax=Vibrio cincinnatiensis TaxID=675 RepID=UPI00130230A1|nr:Wzz/FepE/Etk N-terminal domain-containing protein [Vibrio cincinnatiensis]
MEQQKLTPPNYLTYPPQPVAMADDEIDLRELFKALWQGKWIIIAVTFVFAVGSVLFALSQPNIYKADTLLAPAESSGSGGLAKMAGQLGGLATLAGVNLGSGESSQTELAAQVMKSRQFIQHFIEKYELLVPLMAGKEWDLSSNQLIINNELYDEQTRTWLREPQGLRGAKPTAQEAHEMFVKNILTVSSDKTSGLYTVSVSHYSPYIAQQWATWLVAEINQVMRERTIAETTQNLNYLQEQLQKTSVADMQATFYKLIEEQTKSLMLAEVQDEFIFKVVDPAVVPELKNKPRRALICVLGTLLGGMLGVAVVLVRFAFRREEEVESSS